MARKTFLESRRSRSSTCRRHAGPSTKLPQERWLHCIKPIGRREAAVRGHHFRCGVEASVGAASKMSRFLAGPGLTVCLVRFRTLVIRRRIECRRSGCIAPVHNQSFVQGRAFCSLVKPQEESFGAEDTDTAREPFNMPATIIECAMMTSAGCTGGGPER